MIVSIEENILHVIHQQVNQSLNIYVDQLITTIQLIRLIVNDMLIVQMVRKRDIPAVGFFPTPSTVEQENVDIESIDQMYILSTFEQLIFIQRN